MEERQGVKLQEKFASAVAAVCGLGGLGSNIALSLARAGIGKLILIDFDQVDVSNLHRQQYKASQVGAYKTEALTACLKEIAPYIELETHTVRMTEANTVALLKDADVICEAFDNAECKAMLVNIVLEQMPSKYLVAASGMAGIDSANLIQTRKVMEVIVWSLKVKQTEISHSPLTTALQMPVLLLVHPHVDMAVSFSHYACIVS